jgi:glycosyltransferase involved in cell wall biosynthesis
MHFLSPRISFVGSYVPRRCGIATFTHDLATAVAEYLDQPIGTGDHVSIVAVNDGDNTYDYGPEVALSFRQHRIEEYHRAADFLNRSDAEVVCLQHEFGLFGGEDGIDLLEFVDALHEPLVTTLHTVLTRPTPAQRATLEMLARRSHSLVVMSRRAREMVIDHYDTPPGKVRVVHHGAPDVPFDDTEPYKRRFGLEGRPVILTFGLLNPDKGIEMMIDALRDVVPEFPEVAYVVLGITHPLVRRSSGEAYRLSLESRVLRHGIQDNVEFHNRYATLDDLCDYLRATDIYVTPYAKREQIVSGTLAYAAATGRAVISTPYWYAEEVLADGRGRLMEFGDVDALAEHLRDLLGRPDHRTEIRRAAWDYGRSMIWSAVARRYVDIFQEARRGQTVETLEVVPGTGA